MPALRHLIPAVTALVGVLTGRPAHSAEGDLDPQFNGTGWVGVYPGGGAQGGYMDLLPDGKILLGGIIGRFAGDFPAMLRLLPNGAIDTSLGGIGYSLMDLGWNNTYRPSQMVVQPDGKIIISAQRVQTPFYASFLVRFNQDGTTDTTFANNGRLGISDLYGGGVAVQSDGKILLALRGGVLRYLSDGTPDPSLKPQGVLRYINTSGYIMSVPGGGMLLAGDHELIRLLPDGSSDASFGNQGRAALPFPFTGGLAFQNDGKIIVTGDSPPGFAAARLLPNGTLDATFNGTGQASCSFGPDRWASASRVLVQTDGKVLLVGTSSRRETYAVPEFALARFHAGGLLDTGFGSGGKVTTYLNGWTVEVGGAALLPDGRLLVSGAEMTGVPANFIVARYIVQEGPLIAVEQPAGAAQASRAAAPLDFGIVTIGSRTKEFTVRNIGAAPLVISSVSVTAASHPGQFQAALPAVTSIAPGALTTFRVTFTPAGSGPRTATLTISSNADIASFHIPLTGRLATSLETWRVTWFGSTDNSGNGADLNDFDGDGLDKLLEFAAGTNPHLSSPAPGSLTRTPAGLELLFTRSVAALTSVSWQAESADSPAGPWSTTRITSTIVSDNGTLQTVKTVIPAAASRRFARLRVILAPSGRRPR